MVRVGRVCLIGGLTVLLTNALLMTAGVLAVDIVFCLSVVLCTVFTVKKQKLSRIFLIVCIFTLLGALSFSHTQNRYDKVLNLTGKDVYITGTVKEYPEKTDSGSTVLILSNCTVEQEKIYEKIVLYTKKNNEFVPGDKISFTASELSENSASDIFYYHSLSDKIYLRAFCQSDIEILSENKDKFDIFIKTAELRKAVSDKYFQNMDFENAAVTTALITGDKELLSDEISDNFVAAGVAHIFAVSGMHLALWTGLFFIVLKTRLKVSKIPNIFAIVFIVFYCIFTGLSPSVLRSGIMLSTVFICRLINHKSDPLNTWGLAGIILLIFNPFLAGNISFLLSYLATFAITALAPEITVIKNPEDTLSEKIKKKVRIITDNILVSFCVIFTTLPVTSLFFGYVSLLSPISSLVLTPIAEFLMIISGISVIFPAGNFISDILFNLCEISSEIIIQYTSLMRKFDFAIFGTPKEFIIPWFSVSALVLLFVILRYKSKRMSLICFLTSIALCFCTVAAIDTLKAQTTEIYIPQSGNATNITVCKDTQRNTLMYGVGGTYTSFSDSCAFLNRKGILDIDYLVIPRNKYTENNRKAAAQISLLPKNTYNLYDFGEEIFTKELWENTFLTSENSENFNAAVLYTDSLKIIICSLPTSDFTDKNPVYSSGDILICRNKIPNTLETENFGSVIIMTDREYENLPDNIYTTYTGDITITAEGNSYVINN